MKSKNCEKQDNSTDLRPSQRRRLPSGHKVLNWRWYFFGWHNQSVVWCHPLVIVCLRPTCHHRPVHGHSFYCPFLPNYLSARWWHLNSRTKANGSRGPSFASINEFSRQRHLIAFNRSLNSIYWVHLGSTSSFHESQNSKFFVHLQPSVSSDLVGAEMQSHSRAESTEISLSTCTQRPQWTIYS